MNTHNIKEVKMQLACELYKHQILGFDTVREAVQAILTHDNWTELWDCNHEDCARLRVLGELYKELKFRGAA